MQILITLYLPSVAVLGWSWGAAYTPSFGWEKIDKTTKCTTLFVASANNCRCHFFVLSANFSQCTGSNMNKKAVLSQR